MLEEFIIVIANHIYTNDIDNDSVSGKCKVGVEIIGSCGGGLIIFYNDNKSKLEGILQIECKPKNRSDLLKCDEVVKSITKVEIKDLPYSKQ